MCHDSCEVRPCSRSLDGQAVRQPPDGARLQVAQRGGLRLRKGEGQHPILESPVVRDDGKTLIWRVAADGGDAEPITTPGQDGYDTSHWWPEVLPGGGQLLYTSCCGRTRVMAVDLATGEQSLLLENGFFARYAPTGHIVFAQGDSLLAAPFDLGSLDVGTPSPVLEGIVTGHEMHARIWHLGLRSPRLPCRNIGVKPHTRPN